MTVMLGDVKMKGRTLRVELKEVPLKVDSFPQYMIWRRDSKVEVEKEAEQLVHVKAF